MAVGKPSSRPCVVCGQHKGNIVEPVSMHTKCLDHRRYFTKPERIAKVLSDKFKLDSTTANEYAEAIMEVL